MRSRRHGDISSARVDTLDMARRFKQDFEVERLMFIRQEIDLARTFLELAEQSKNDVDCKRNLVHARRAYHSVLDLLRSSNVTPAGRVQIDPELQRLKERIDSLEDPRN